MLDILGKSNVKSKGVVNPHEVFSEQGAIEAFEKFLDDPNNIRFIKYFAAEYVSENLYDRLRTLPGFRDWLCICYPEAGPVDVCRGMKPAFSSF